MKLYNIALLGAFATVLMTGCELKEELWGEEDVDTRSKGSATLDVAVKLPASQTRADETVDTQDFPVTIQGLDEVSDIKKEYATLSSVPSEITLPVGEYKVSSHTPGEITEQMDKPYYAGTKDITITKGINSEAVVTCKMKNSHIRIKYGESFLTDFSSWVITIDDGINKTLTFSNEKKGEEGIYWYFKEGEVEIITVNIDAVTSEGNTVSEQRQFSKANASEEYEDVNDYFEGGDAIVVQMGSVKASNGEITDITINANITFSEKSETVEIPVFGENAKVITITDGNTGYLINGVQLTANSVPTDAMLAIDVPEGLKSLNVALNTDNVELAGGMAFMAKGITSAAGIDLVTASQTLFTNKPIAGAISYTLDFTTFVNQAKDYIGEHTFTIIVTDETKQTLTQTLKITTSEETSGGGNGGGDSDAKLPVVTMPSDITMTVAEASAASKKADALITAPNGIQSMIVKIISGNEGFVEALQLLINNGPDEYGKAIDFINGEELVGNNAVESLLANVGSATPMPVAGEISYSFPIGNFFKFISLTGSTNPGTPHEFHIELTDNAGKTVTSVFKITLTE